MRLDITILRKNRRQDVLSVEGDPDDTGAMEKILKGWLDSNGWDKGRWSEFVAEARAQGSGKVLATVRA